MNIDSDIKKGKQVCLLSTAYFPPIEYFAAMVKYDSVIIEACEIYQKQSYRTRCYIYSSNGVFVLGVPVLRDTGLHSHKIPIRDIKIDYSEPWVMQHERALIAAYMNSPFFEYYSEEIFEVLEKKEKFLFDLNLKIILLLKQLIGNINSDISLSESFLSSTHDENGNSIIDSGDSIIDLRNRIHPKYKGENLLSMYKIQKPYFQVFSQKQGFISNLSSVDLLFNEGPNSISFLR